MNSNYQMYLKLNEVFRFPVLPESITVSYGSNNDSLKVCGVGEITILQDSAAATIKFSSFFPSTYFSGCGYKNIPSPKSAVDTIIGMKESKKPVRFTITGGIGVSMYCTIENLDVEEMGGDIGTLSYSIKLKEYRVTKVRQIQVNIETKKARISTLSRADNSIIGSSYTVVSGDCLWNIAKKFYGSGIRHTDIYNANATIIEDVARAHGKSSSSNGHWIWPGTVLTIPA